jgi:acyl-CoA reductase-like NAD-dependent aldehyde dehydrogenase
MPIGLIKQERADALVTERLPLLDAVRRTLEEHPEPVLDVLTRISPYKAAVFELRSAIETLAGAAEEVRAHRPRQLALLAVFMPSNVLLYSYVLYLLLPSLYTERVVVRPASVVREPFRDLHELLAAEHGLPIELSGASQREFVQVPVAAADLVVFTGAYRNAEQVRACLRPEQLMLFFGQGINPFVVGEHADLRRAAEDAIRIRLLNSGQDCFAPDVFLVHQAVRDGFVAELSARLASLKCGDYVDPQADYGPLYYDSALQHIAEYLRRNQERIVHGGRVDFRTGVVEPTVILGTMKGRPAVSELFAPVFNVVGYSALEQLRDCLTSPYFEERAMGAMVYGAEAEVTELLAAKHTVAVERTLLDVENGNRPFGGRGVMANYAALHRKLHAEPLLISKAVGDYLGHAGQP